MTSSNPVPLPPASLDRHASADLIQPAAGEGRTPATCSRGLELRAESLCRHYRGSEGQGPTGGGIVAAVDGVTLHIAAGEFCAITGPSGCGKSTLLHLFGALDHPDSGRLFAGDLPLHELDETARTRYRRHSVGIVFQFFHLMPTLSVGENVALPLILQGVKPHEASRRAEHWLERTGIGHRRDHLLHQLSGGEMQRAAIARALAPEPRLLLADEPTGNLDSANEEQILELLTDLHRERAPTLLLVTHSQRVAARAGRHVRLRDGRLVDE